MGAAGYVGVMYDVEEVQGPSSTMAPLFSKSFEAMKSAGLLVMVTTSHSAPYQCDTAQDAVDILKAWCADDNLDVISPQLYSSGRESKPELVPTNSCKDAGCTWICMQIARPGLLLLLWSRAIMHHPRLFSSKASREPPTGISCGHNKKLL